MVKWLLLGQMKDLQTGLYDVNSLEEIGEEVEFVDIRHITDEIGVMEGQTFILDAIEKLSYIPDNILVFKGMEMTPETLIVIKAMFPKANLINWFYDIQIAGVDIWKNETFFPALRLYDYFFCSLDGVVSILRDKGFNNVYHVGEGCYLPLHGEQYANNFQKTKYGGDVAFIGSVGIDIHADRIALLSRVIKEGFNIKIWGPIYGKQKSVPSAVRNHMSGTEAINETHSVVCANTLVNLGIDANPNLYGSMSARLYRVMCAGGCYLTTATRGIDKYFKINIEGEEISPDQEVVVFYDSDDLVKKLDFLLEHDAIRESIAKNGQKVVQEKHQFVHRVKDMIEVMKK